MNCSICSNIKTWLNQPFNQNGSVVNWVLFVGLVMVIIFFWTRILKRIAP